MHPDIAARFNPDILQAALACYAVTPRQATLLDGFESFIYEFNRPDGDYILRLGHSLRRSRELICGEVDWINALAAAGVGVARAILSEQGSLVEAVPDAQGGEFLCTAFIKAPGEPPRNRRSQAGEPFFHAYGSLLGQMHTLARTYQPSNPAWRRYTWDSPANNNADQKLPASEGAVLAVYHELFARLSALPRPPEGYGLIHQDAHTGNLFVDQAGRLTLFDFDDCVYGHFIYDLAMVVFYISGWGGDDVPAFLDRILPPFLAGYRQHYRLDPAWLAELPHFLKFREIDLFAAILQAMGEHPEDEWCANYMKGRRERILSGQPFIDYDWQSLAPWL